MQRVEKEHIGKRVLLRKNWSSLAPDEYIILEVSPSEEHFKAKTPDGKPCWHKTSEYRIDEVLPQKLPNIPGI